MNNQETLANRYQILSQIGQGGSGITYQGKDLNTGETVALKILALGKSENWQQLNYFEREVQVLQQLDHPKIPKYLDYFVRDCRHHTYYPLTSSQDLNSLLEQGIKPDQFYLVQEFIQGQSLDKLIENGWIPEENEVKNIAGQILKILIYLQELNPPVIHRDIKPHNLIYTENKEVFLVDFGGVQERIRQTTYASSVVGTYGYMSPEQFRGGKTYLSTDLYGLGATLIHLLSGKHPSDFPQKRLKIDFADAVNISPELREWIDKLIEPDYRNRIPSAQIALDILEGRKELNDQVTSYLAQPRYSSLKLVKTKEKLTLTIPCALNRKQYNYCLAGIGIGFYVMIALILFMLCLSNYWSYGFYGFHLEIVYLTYFILLLSEIFILNPKRNDAPSWFGLARWLIKLIILIIPHPYNTFFDPCSMAIAECYIHEDLFMMMSPLILIPESIFGRIFRNIIRELIGDTILQIYPDQTVSITQKLGFFPSQELSYRFDETELNSQYMRLLTEEERLWVNQQIEQFLKRS